MKSVNEEMLDALRQIKELEKAAAGGNGGPTTNNYYLGHIAQKIDHVDTVNFSMDGNGEFHFSNVGSMKGVPAGSKKGGYSDKQVSEAIEAIIAKKSLDQKQKWVGVLWVLRWVANYPPDAHRFCERVGQLPLKRGLYPPCTYNNIRNWATLPFLNYDPRKMDEVVVRTNDKAVFDTLREVAQALLEEL